MKTLRKQREKESGQPKLVFTKKGEYDRGYGQQWDGKSQGDYLSIGNYESSKVKKSGKRGKGRGGALPRGGTVKGALKEKITRSGGGKAYKAL